MITFLAVDKDSSQSHTKSVKATTQEQLAIEWATFENDVNKLFRKWYFDNDADTDEEIQMMEKLSIL